MNLLLNNPYILLVAIMWFSGAIACIGSRDYAPLIISLFGTFCVWVVWALRQT